MEIKEFLNARFLTPPIITIFFVFLANPERVLLFFKNNDNLATLILAPVFIFGLGFLISTFTTAFCVIPKKLRKTIDADAIKESGIYNFIKDPKKENYTETALEMATWFAVLDTKEENLEYIRGQLHKRWHAFNASINSIIGIIIAIALVFIAGVGFWEKYSWWCYAWFVMVIVFILAFYVTKKDAHKSVIEIDNIMVRKYLENKSTESKKNHKD